MTQTHFKDTWLEQMKLKKERDIVDKEYEQNAPVGSPMNFLSRKLQTQ